MLSRSDHGTARTLVVLQARPQGFFQTDLMVIAALLRYARSVDVEPILPCRACSFVTDQSYAVAPTGSMRQTGVWCPCRIQTRLEACSRRPAYPRGQALQPTRNRAK